MVQVRMYDCRTEGNVNVATNFKVKEFKSKDTNIVCIHTDLPPALQKIRDKVKKPVTMTNSYRTEAHNSRVGGASQSKHLYGMAADIYVAGMSALDFARTIDSVFPGKYGIIAYTKQNFVHFDVRAVAYRGIDNGTLKNVSKF